MVPRSMIARWSLCVFAARLAFRHAGVSAWNPDGHERIARIADPLLTGKHRDQIRTMMHGGLIDLANFEETMLKQFPGLKGMHFHRQSPEWSCGKKFGLGDDTGHLRCDDHGAERGSLLCAMAYFFEHFADENLLMEYEKPKEPIETPQSLKVLKAFVPASGLSSQNYLRWLVILLGDLHQPLHWLQEHQFGKDVMIEYQGEFWTLYAFWEEYLPRHFHPLQEGLHPEVSSRSGAGGVQDAVKSTVAQVLSKTYKDEYGVLRKGWEHKAPTELFREWAKEEAAKVCEEVYQPMTVNHADGPRVDSPFKLTEELFQKWLVLAEGLTALAGERLAFILNDIIEHKRHKEAHAEGRALPSRRIAVGTELVAGSPEEVEKANAAAKAANEAMKEHAKAAHAKRVAEAAATSRPPPPGSNGTGPSVDFEEFARLHAKKFGPGRALKIRQKSRSSGFLSNLCIAALVVPALLFALTKHAEQNLGKSSWQAKKRDM